MLPYWILFSASSVLAITGWWRTTGVLSKVIALLIGIGLTFFVGYRFEIGADWLSYEAIFLDIKNMNLGEALTYIEPAYAFVNWVVGWFDGQIWHANLICAALFAWALVRFCLMLPMPGVALLAAVPTLIIVVSMAYTRQACAVACIMFAIRAFNGTFNWRWVAWLSLGAAFHNSAIIMFPIIILAASRNRMVSIAMGAAVILSLLVFFILENAQGLILRYFEGEVTSSGTLPRIGLAIIPAFLFFLIKERKEVLGNRYLLWRNMAFASMLLLPMIFFVRSTTVIDRIGVLLLPFQLLVYSMAPLAFTEKKMIQQVIVAGIILMNLALLGVWLSFAEYSNAWLPYRNVIFEEFI